MKKQRREDTERTWTRLGATREQAQRLLGIRRVTLTDAAIEWLDAGGAVVRDGLFYRDPAAPAAGVE